MGVETKLVKSEGNIAYRPWVGFLHLTSSCVRSDHMTDEFTKNAYWHESLKSCKGLFTLSEDAAKAVREKVNVRVESVKHPTETNVPHFSLVNRQDRVLFVGHWLRNHPFFEKLKTNLKKTSLQSGYKFNKNIEMLRYLPKAEYDYMLATNVVFLALYASSANNTVIECIVRNTPLLVNRLRALEEYLGEGYPFFYSSLDEAAAKLADSKLIAETHHYLAALDKSFLTLDHFVQSVASSHIYQSL